MVDTVCTRSHARAPRDSWSTLRDIGHGPESPGTAGRHRGPSEKGPSCARQLVKPACSRTRTRVNQGAGRPRWPSDSTASHPRLLVEPAGSQTRIRDHQNYWSTPRVLGYRPKLPRTDGLHNGPLDTGPSHPGYLVDNAVHLTGVRVAWVSWSPHGTSGSGPRCPGSLVECGPKVPGPSLPGPLVDPGVLGPKRETPVTAGQPCGPSDKGWSPPGQLVEPSGPRTWAQVTQDSWSTPRVFRHWPGSRRTAGQHRGPSDPSAIRPGDLVETASLGHGHEWPETPGQPREALGTLTSCSGQLVHCTCPRARARVAQDTCSTLRYLRRGPESPRTTGRPRALGP